LTICKKAAFEKLIKDAIEQTTKLWTHVKVAEQHFDGCCTSNIVLEVEIAINGYLEDVPFAGEAGSIDNPQLREKIKQLMVEHREKIEQFKVEHRRALHELLKGLSDQDAAILLESMKTE
jgi:hypothetical protein